MIAHPYLRDTWPTRGAFTSRLLLLSWCAFPPRPPVRFPPPSATSFPSPCTSPRHVSSFFFWDLLSVALVFLINRIGTPHDLSTSLQLVVASLLSAQRWKWV
jgi:hypothetical protein